jgi:hypothetical protein
MCWTIRNATTRRSSPPPRNSAVRARATWRPRPAIAPASNVGKAIFIRIVPSVEGGIRLKPQNDDSGNDEKGLVNAFVERYVSSSYQTVISFAPLLSLLAVRPQDLTGSQWE